MSDPSSKRSLKAPNSTIKTNQPNSKGANYMLRDRPMPADELEEEFKDEDDKRRGGPAPFASAKSRV